jgi:signal transduction histidine kinase
MSPEFFTPFLTVFFESIRQKKGRTGLGLSINKQIIDLQKGEITIDGKIGKERTI